jgi:hypothetical protein
LILLERLGRGSAWGWLLQVIPYRPVGDTEHFGDLPLLESLSLKDFRLHHTMLLVHGLFLGWVGLFCDTSLPEKPMAFFSTESGKSSSVILGKLSPVMTTPFLIVR